MAIAFDSYTGPEEDTAPLTFSHTCTGSDVCLVVAVCEIGGVPITSVTYNGEALTLGNTETVPSGGPVISVYYLLDAPTGANDVVVDTGAGGTVRAHATSYTGVGNVVTEGLDPDTGAPEPATATDGFHAGHDGSGFTVTGGDPWGWMYIRDSSSDPLVQVSWNSTVGMDSLLPTPRSTDDNDTIFDTETGLYADDWYGGVFTYNVNVWSASVALLLEEGSGGGDEVPATPETDFAIEAELSAETVVANPATPTTDFAVETSAFATSELILQTPARTAPLVGLGHGEWRAFIASKGGETIYGELDYTSLDMSRVLDDASTASVTVNMVSDNPGSYDCDLINLIVPWQHELVLYRDSELAWCGPIVEPLTFSREQVEIGARDLFAWYERNTFPYPHDYLNVDLATILEQYAQDLVNADVISGAPSMNLQIEKVGLAWVSGDREVVLDYRYMADDMRELARSGPDFTCIGRRMIIGGGHLNVPTLGILTDDAFMDLTIEARGGVYANVVVVVGRSEGGFPPVGIAENLTEIRKTGRVVMVYQEDNIMEQVGLDYAAWDRLRFLSRTPFFPAGSFAPDAPVEFRDLIPGTMAELRMQLGCKILYGHWRISQIDVTVSEGVETITPTFIPAFDPTRET